MKVAHFRNLWSEKIKESKRPKAFLPGRWTGNRADSQGHRARRQNLGKYQKGRCSDHAPKREIMWVCETRHFFPFLSCALRQHQQQMMMASPLAPHDIPYGSCKRQTQKDYFDTIAITIQNMVVFSWSLWWSGLLPYAIVTTVQYLI